MNPYKVEIDGVVEEVQADSLAALTNAIRGRGNRIKVWSPVGLMLIDTFYGDVYCLIRDFDGRDALLEMHYNPNHKSPPY